MEEVKYIEIPHRLQDIVLSAKTQIPIKINVTQNSALEQDRVLYLLNLIQNLQNEKEKNL